MSAQAKLFVRSLEDFQILRFLIIARSHESRVYLSNPFDEEAPTLKYLMFGHLIKTDSCYDIDYIIMEPNYSVKIEAEHLMTASKIKSSAKKLIEYLRKKHVPDDAPFWPCLIPSNRANVSFGSPRPTDALMMPSFANYEFNRLYFYAKRDKDYILNHPFTINKIISFLQHLSDKENPIMDEFLILQREMYKSKYFELRDFVLASANRISKTVPFGEKDRHFNGDATLIRVYTESFFAFLRIIVPDIWNDCKMESLKGYIRSYMKNARTSEAFIDAFTDEIFASKELSDVIEIIKMNKDEDKYPDIRYYFHEWNMNDYIMRR